MCAPVLYLVFCFLILSKFYHAFIVLQVLLILYFLLLTFAWFELWVWNIFIYYLLADFNLLEIHLDSAKYSAYMILLYEHNLEKKKYLAAVIKRVLENYK